MASALTVFQKKKKKCIYVYINITFKKIGKLNNIWFAELYCLYIIWSISEYKISCRGLEMKKNINIKIILIKAKENNIIIILRNYNNLFKDWMEKESGIFNGFLIFVVYDTKNLLIARLYYIKMSYIF